MAGTGLDTESASGVRETIEREVRILRAAVALVAAGSSERVTVQGLHHAPAVLPGVRLEGRAAGVSVLMMPAAGVGVCVTVEPD